MFPPVIKPSVWILAKLWGVLTSSSGPVYVILTSPAPSSPFLFCSSSILIRSSFSYSSTLLFLSSSSANARASISALAFCSYSYFAFASASTLAFASCSSLIFSCIAINSILAFSASSLLFIVPL